MLKHKGNLPHAHFNVTDLESMDSKWRVEFEREVQENNFVRGGKSLVLIGKGATLAAEQWAACLLLAGMNVYVTDPVEILRRLRGQYIPRDTEQLKSEFEEAATIHIRKFFDVNEAQLTVEDRTDLEWYIDQAIQDGCVILVATDNERATTGLYQIDEIGDLIENNFEAIHGTAARKAKTKP